MGQQFGGLRRLTDLSDVKIRAAEVLTKLDEGTL
jgi:hypothetical protein